MNRLAGYEAAIVTATPGTTRDVLRERVLLGGVPLHLLDTAGLRPRGEALRDPIEAEGIRRARSAMASADHLLFVVDAREDPCARAFAEERAQLPAGIPITLLINKVDAAAEPLPPERCGATGAVELPAATLHISALTGQGIATLTEHLRRCAAGAGGDGGVVSARSRHIEALGRADSHLQAARSALDGRRHPELVAEELRRAQQALGEILSAEGAEELLGRIFASFCIGK